MNLPTESTLLAEFTYEPRPVERGYANRTLYINLTDSTIIRGIMRWAQSQR